MSLWTFGHVSEGFKTFHGGAEETMPPPTKEEYLDRVAKSMARDG